MIIFDLRLGPFSILAQHEPYQRTLKVTREGPREVAVDLPCASIILTDFRRTICRSQ